MTAYQYTDGLNYSFGKATLWVSFMMRRMAETMEISPDRVVVLGYNLDSPVKTQEQVPAITIQERTIGDYTAPKIGGSTSTAITRTINPTYLISATGDHGDIYNLWLLHFYNGSPQYLIWCTEYEELYKTKCPEWSDSKIVNTIGTDAFGAGQSWTISFIQAIEISPSNKNIEDIIIPPNAVIAIYE